MNALCRKESRETNAVARQSAQQSLVHLGTSKRGDIYSNLSALSIRALGGARKCHFLSIITSVLVLALLSFHSVALAESDPNASTDKIAIGNTTFLKFIKFDLAEYQHEKSGEIEAVVHQLKLIPQDTPIRLIGHSQSRTSLATESLAFSRAKVVEKKLIEHGITAERIQLDTEIVNFKEQGDLSHGVLLLAIPSEETGNHKLATINKSAGNQTIEQIAPQAVDQRTATRESTQTVEQVASAIPYPKTTTNVEPAGNLSLNSSANIDPCAQVVIHTGSLKANLEREIGDCGYVMGDWKFGSSSELIDWEIPIGYSLSVDDGIFGVLSLIEHNYQIRAHVHQLDRSIDFLASVRHRRDRNQ